MLLYMETNKVLFYISPKAELVNTFEKRQILHQWKGKLPATPVLLRYNMYRHLADYDFLQNDKEG